MTLKTTLLLLLAPLAAQADVKSRLDASIALGGHFFANDVELGSGERADDPGPANSGLIAGRAALRMTKRLAAETELMFIPTSDDVMGVDADVYGVRAQARFDVATGKVRPFLVAGVGALVMRSNSAQLDNDMDPTLHMGGGIRILLGKRLDLRADIRDVLAPDRSKSGLAHDLEVSAGIGFRFGGSKPAPRPVRQEIVVANVEPSDLDRDGIIDEDDACTDRPEDFDLVEDEDGCPDEEKVVEKVVETLPEIDDILFAESSWRISPHAMAVLDRVYDIMASRPDLKLQISGHASAEGDWTKNQELSIKRAETVATYLTKRGIDPKRIESMGYGSDRNSTDETTEEGRRMNRRIELDLVKSEGK